MTNTIKKAVFPVAGLGTRFLPATKANPKEMLPIVDKPLIQYAVEEALSAGVTQLIFVTSSYKRTIEDHFDSNYELESKLEERGKYQLLSLVRGIIPEGVSCVYIRQHNPLGLGHAVLCAKPVVGDEPFAVLLADDLIESSGNKTCMMRMAELFAKTQNSIIGVQTIDPIHVDKYGIVELTQPPTTPPKIKSIVEKPKVNEAPSNLAAVGRYILSPRIFSLLENIEYGAGNELQLTDAIAQLLDHEAVHIHQLVGKRYDCGSRLGYLKATVNYALKHPDVGDAFREYLEQFSLEQCQ